MSNSPPATIRTPARHAADRKLRFGGILENPLLSRWQRDLLDAGRIQALKKALAAYRYETLLDVGCGLGEGVTLRRQTYFGLDNSLPRVRYAAGGHPDCGFLLGDARRLPFRTNCADMVTLFDTSHHLNDEEFRQVARELGRVSRKYVVVSDPVLTRGQNWLSSFVYRLDRGGCFRREDEMRSILEGVEGLKIEEVSGFSTFPGLYRRAAFILRSG